MTILTTIKSIINEWDRRSFYIWIGTFVGIVYLMHLVIIIHYYSKKKQAYNTIEEINQLRTTQVKKIIMRAYKVKDQQKAVDIMLKEEEDFKIGQYMDKLINDPKLAISNKALIAKPASIEKNDRYIEQAITAQFGSMNMKELTTLLSLIDEKRRVYTKNLEINTSKKEPNTIDVNITIATLEPKK